MASNKLVSFDIKPRLAEQLRAALASVFSTSTPAIVLRDQNEKTVVGVVVPAEEYELLMATYKLVKSPDGPAKIAGTYPYRERLPEAVLLEEALQSHR